MSKSKFLAIILLVILTFNLIGSIIYTSRAVNIIETTENIENNTNFKLQGYDLYTDLCLTPWEAAVGTRANVKTIDDETKVYIPQGIQSGEKIRIPGKGYKTSSGTRGDLIAEVKVMVPKKLTQEERMMFEKLNKISNFNPRSINN